MSTTSETSAASALAAAFGRFGPAYMKWMTAGVSGTTYARLRLLHVLQREGPQIMTAVGDCLAVTPRNVTVLVDGLEAEGHVRRVAHPDDRRATLVELTEAGRRLVEEVFASHTARAVSLFDRMTPQDQETLLRLMRTLTEELVALGADEGCAVHLAR